MARGSDRGVLRRGGKRDFSPYLNRGLGESHSTRVREYASTREKFVDPIWLTPRLGTVYTLIGKVDSVLVAMSVKTEYLSLIHI